MKLKQLLTKSLLVAVCLLVGQSVWADATTAFSQNFTDLEPSSSIPSDYGFALTYGSGSSSSLVNFTVTGGVLQCVAGPYASSGDGARTGTATATFTPISSGNLITVSYVWALGEATGNTSGSYTKTRIGGPNGNALELSFYGSDGGSLKVNGTTVKSNSKIRSTTYTVNATLDMNQQKITALTLTCSNTTYSYTAPEAISFASEVTSVDRFAFENSERQGWANTSSIDDVNITYEELPKYAYTINYTYGGETISSEEGTEYEGLKVDASKSSMWNEGNTKKYYVANNATTSFDVTNNEASNVFEVALREAETWNYTVNCIDGSSNILKSIIGTVVEEETAKVPYPNFINYNGTLYSTSAIDSQYRKDFATTSDNTTTTITYSPTNTTDVIFYVEGEDIPNAEKVNTGGTYSRTSGCATAKTPEGTSKRLVTLPAGSYKATVYFYNSSSSGSRTVKITDGTNTLYTHGFGNGRQNYTSEESFALTETTTLYIDGGYSSANVQSGIDLVYITGTPTNEIIGDFVDYSTSFLGDTKDLTIAQGKKMVLNFKNHGGSSNWLNWILRTYQDEGIDYRLRADNYATDGNNSDASAWGDDKIKWDILVDGAAPDWNTIWTEFPGQMADASVEMVITYTNAGKLSMCATSTGSSKTYTHKFVCGEALSGDVKLQLGVWNSWIEFVSATTTDIETVSKNISSAGWATLYTDKVLDFSGIEGLKAYTATLSENTVTLTEVQNVPANTGVVLKGTAKDYSIPVIASSLTAQGSMKGNATEGVALEENTAYILGINGSGNAQFFINSAGTIAAGKAYLPVGTNLAKALTVVFADDVTGIANVNAAEAVQPVKRIVKGQLVIEKNGKRYNAAGAEF